MPQRDLHLIDNIIRRPRQWIPPSCQHRNEHDMVRRESIQQLHRQNFA